MLLICSSTGLKLTIGTALNEWNAMPKVLGFVIILDNY